MQLRGLVALSLCALIGAVPSAYAATQSSSVIQTDSVASAQNTKKPLKKGTKGKKAVQKELTPAEKKALEKQKLADEKKAKADAAKKLAEQKKTEAAKKLAEKKKADDARKLAKAKELDARKAAAAKAAELKKMAAAKAADERAAAKAAALEAKQAAAKARTDALAADRMAKAKAKEDARLAKVAALEEAQQAKLRAAEDARQRELAQLTAMEIVSTGNNGELRSEVAQPVVQQTGFLGLFGSSAPRKVSVLAETRALDAVLEQRDAKKKFKVNPEFEPQTVSYPGYESGTIVIDTAERRLYLVQSLGKARRYAIAVGRDGLQYKGAVTVGDKQEWPRWIPTKEMQARSPEKYARYKEGMPGGPTNPLGARAIYLYDGKKDTHLRIHGTTEPQSIGTSASNGCFRMINEHVQDLYSRVKLGTHVVVL